MLHVALDSIEAKDEKMENGGVVLFWLILYLSTCCVISSNFSCLKTAKRKQNCFSRSPFLEQISGSATVSPPEILLPLTGHQDSELTHKKKVKVTYVTPNFWSWTVELLEHNDFTLVPTLEIRVAF